MAGRQDGIFGFIAHIVADIEGGPRGDPIRSPQLARSLENVMLMCARHHKLIDLDAVDDHPESILLAMKADHEARIAIVGSINEDRASHVIRFGASICDNEALVSTQAIFSAMPPDRHPASGQTLDLEMVGCAFRDDEPAYWTIQRENLRRQFEAKVRGRVERQEIRHLSVFALAPQPLLIELGRLLCDIVPAVVSGFLCVLHPRPARGKGGSAGGVEIRVVIYPQITPIQICVICGWFSLNLLAVGYSPALLDPYPGDLAIRVLHKRQLGHERARVERRL